MSREQWAKGMLTHSEQREFHRSTYFINRKSDKLCLIRKTSVFSQQMSSEVHYQ